jgi:hypothetical protein
MGHIGQSSDGKTVITPRERCTDHNCESETERIEGR